jgi:hypothetical protein
MNFETQPISAKRTGHFKKHRGHSTLLPRNFYQQAPVLTVYALSLRSIPVRPQARGRMHSLAPSTYSQCSLRTSPSRQSARRKGHHSSQPISHTHCYQISGATATRLRRARRRRRSMRVQRPLGSGYVPHQGAPVKIWPSAEAHPENGESIRVMGGLGMEKVGTEKPGDKKGLNIDEKDGSFKGRVKGLGAVVFGPGDSSLRIGAIARAAFESIGPSERVG